MLLSLVSQSKYHINIEIIKDVNVMRRDEVVTFDAPDTPSISLSNRSRSEECDSHEDSQEHVIKRIKTKIKSINLI